MIDSIINAAFHALAVRASAAFSLKTDGVYQSDQRLTNSHARERPGLTNW
jgi:hypothetical protein